jgi:Putative adhesin
MSTLTQPAREHRTPQPVRRALHVAAALFALAAVAFGALSLLDLASRHTTTERSSYDGVRSLVVEGASDVTLTGAPAGGSLEVVARVTEGLRSPSHSGQRTGDGELRLSASCPGFFGGRCAVDYEIRVPSGTVVRADASGGDVVAEEITTTEPFRLESSAGDVTANDVTAPAIELSSSAGDVSGRALSAERLELESSAGDVTASLRTPAERLLADSSAGDVELVVPDEVYRLDASSSAGDVDASDVSTDPDAPRAIVARSSAGDVRVIARR